MSGTRPGAKTQSNPENTVGLLATVCYSASATAWALLVQQLGTLLYIVAGGAFLGWAYTATPFGLKCVFRRDTVADSHLSSILRAARAHTSLWSHRRRRNGKIYAR